MIKCFLLLTLHFLCNTVKNTTSIESKTIVTTAQPQPKITPIKSAGNSNITVTDTVSLSTSTRQDDATSNSTSSMFYSTLLIS